jgi:cytochrome c oxidase subunit II
MNNGVAATIALYVVGLSGCAGHQQSSIDPAGTQADKIAGLWWFFFWTTAVIFAIVMTIALLALMRRYRAIEQEPVESTHMPSAGTETKLTRVVTGATVLTVLILTVMLVASVSTGKSISSLSREKNAMTIEVTGNQWWWQFRYVSDDPRRVLITANEIHIPVGRPIMIRGVSQDVIHSFWVPNLHGKRDLIPSRTTVEWIKADSPGRFRGQCAEFCGMQHAHMAFWVIAEPENQFETWMQHQLEPAAEPTDPVAKRGQQVFLDHACVFCHAIRGTIAAATNAPDLTHFGSRLTIAAGTLPNNLGNLGGWISDPQTIKPGNHMATIPVPPADLQPLIEYLENLK